MAKIDFFWRAVIEQLDFAVALAIIIRNQQTNEALAARPDKDIDFFPIGAHRAVDVPVVDRINDGRKARMGCAIGAVDGYAVLEDAGLPHVPFEDALFGCGQNMLRRRHTVTRLVVVGRRQQLSRRNQRQERHIETSLLLAQVPLGVDSLDYRKQLPVFRQDTDLGSH